MPADILTFQHDLLQATYSIQRNGILNLIPIQGVIQDICALNTVTTPQCTAKINMQKAPCKCPIEKVFEYSSPLRCGTVSQLQLSDGAEPKPDIPCYTLLHIYNVKVLPKA